MDGGDYACRRICMFLCASVWVGVPMHSVWLCVCVFCAFAFVIVCVCVCVCFLSMFMMVCVLARCEAH